jgi:hypothetical protein
MAIGASRCGNLLNMNDNLKKFILRSPVGTVKRKFFPKKAVITKSDFPATGDLMNGQGLIIAVDPQFKQDRPHSTTMIVNGYAKGWSNAVGPARIVDISRLMSEVKKFEKPAILISTYLLSYLSLNDCQKLSDENVAMFISIHPKKIHEFEARFLGAKTGPDTKIWQENYPKVMAVQPKLLCTFVGRDGMEWFNGWKEDGLRLETVHLAANDDIYFPDPDLERFGQIEMAYVGGYWPEKAQAFDRYLRPYEDILWTYGYAKWPYKNYGGMLTEAEERQLYSSAGIIPLITSPGGWMLAEITERYYKAPACRAFCIADENPALREIFNQDEMLQAESAEHFQELVEQVRQGKIDKDLWAKKAYEAIRSRHLYKHRALQVHKSLNKHQP